MVRPHKKGGRRKNSEEGKRTLEKQEEGRKADGNEQVSEDTKNPQLEGENPGSKVMEENHRRDKDEQGIGIGTKEIVK